LRFTFVPMEKLPISPELKKGGMILVDKPYKWTSFDAIHKLKILLRTKVGHCGTLDPLATGLLICCTGGFTKKISEYQQLPKEYAGIFHLGATTATYDRESNPQDFKPFEHITEQQVHETVKQFTGNILQTPPIHSAIKKDGKRAYDLARKGVEVILEPRPVTITEFEITAVQLPEVHFRVLCTTGTYIRSLAHDFGQALSCGAYLQELRRTKIGIYDVKDALTPEDWGKYWRPEKAVTVGVSE